MSLCYCVMFWIINAVSADDNINRGIYTNFHGNAQHDGYLKFGSSTFKFPLKSVWNITTNACYGPGQIKPAAIFVNNTYYCIKTEINPSTGIIMSSTIFAINPLNGQILWTNKLFLGAVSITYALSNDVGYLAIYDEYTERIWILNANNGDCLSQIPFYLPRYDAPPVITSYNGLFYGFNNYFEYELFSIDPEQGKIIKSMQFNLTNDFIPYLQAPTFCMNGEIIILYDVYTIFAAFNSSTFELLWSNSLSVTNGNWMVPTICIEPDKILMVDSLNGWQIVDAKTGKNISVINLGAPVNYLQPPVYHVDKKILIRDNQKNSNGLSAMNISDPDPKKWNEVWNIRDAGGSNAFCSAMIVDDALIVANQGYVVKVYDINNGTLLWRHDFTHSNQFRNTQILPGIDVNGDPILIMQWASQNSIWPQVYAFQ